MSRVVSLAVAISAVVALAGCSSGSSGPSSSAHPQTTAAAHKGPKLATGAVCPLTGLPAHNGQQVSRPALAVKIDNVSQALPQAGLNSADVVVEELVEGGLTRLMAIFQCSKASKVGPIRSARISDADILALLHGSVFGFSGANPRDLPPIVSQGDAVLISQDADPQYFYRSDLHAAPHNVFSSTDKIVKAGIARRHNLKAPKPLFTYGAIDPAAKPAHVVSMHWPAASAGWKWSSGGSKGGSGGSTGSWLRTQDGATDHLLDGSQISTTNVVVLSVKIASTGLHDVLGNASPLDVTVGSNPLWVLRNGKMIRGTWHRATVASPLRLLDKKGHVIHLAPGRTWIELLPTPAKVSKG
jgi:Protein of unknown function (DUF3048) N-terminal domain/Protein of unknown function (DUF3048) C-terminal domain